MSLELDPIDRDTAENTDDDRDWLLVTDVGTVVLTRSGESRYYPPQPGPLPQQDTSAARGTNGPTRTYKRSQGRSGGRQAGSPRKPYKRSYKAA